MVTNREIWKIILIYVLFSTALILLADTIPERYYPTDSLPWSVAKGGLFIVSTSILLYALFIRQQSRLNNSITALRDTEQRFEFLVENSSDCLVVINDEGYQKYVSASARNLFGFSSEELEGKHIKEIIHPDDIPIILKTWEKVTSEQHQSVVVRYRHLHKNGEWVHCEAVGRNFLANPAIKGVIASVRDITERKQAEQALRERNLFISTILDNLPIGLAVNYIDSGKTTYMNRQFEKIYGWPREELQDREQFFENVFPEAAYREKIQTLVMEDIQSGDVEKMHWTNIEATTKEGNKRTIDAKNIPIYGQNLMISTVQDITESRKLQKQLEQVQKLESIGRLAGGIAHDFNNLLTPILGYSELLLENSLEKQERNGHVAEIRKAGMRARDLVQQLLAFSRKQILQFGPVDINRTIASFEKMLRRTIPEDIEIVVDLRQDLQPVRGDAGQIEQVLMNLAVNSADAMPGGGTLTLTTDRVTFSSRQISNMEGVTPGTYVAITVVDTGIGMDEKTAKNVFDPFFSTKGEYGTGLGLAMAYGIIKQHSGNIWVTSRPGHGTTFKIYLPLSEEALPEEPVEQKHIKLEGDETILIAEDAYQVRALTRRYLEKLGYTVLEAENGERALTLAEASSKPINLLLADVVMPGINGPQLYKEMADMYPDLKVLYMSGHSGSVITHRGILDKDAPFIQKPFDQRTIAGKVRMILDK